MPEQPLSASLPTHLHFEFYQFDVLQLPSASICVSEHKELVQKATLPEHSNPAVPGNLHLLIPPQSPTFHLSQPSTNDQQEWVCKHSSSLDTWEHSAEKQEWPTITN